MFFSGKRPRNLGVKNNKLAPCPTRPNCVSTACADKLHHIAPFSFKDNPTDEMKKLRDILGNMSGVDVIEFRDNYLYVECRTKLMGFVDDLEFFWDSGEQVCHIRSASRLGISDLGQNRRRVESIRSAFLNSP